MRPGMNRTFLQPFSQNIDFSLLSQTVPKWILFPHIVAHCANSVQPDASSSKVWSLMDS